MLFCQMGAAHSLREIRGGLATACGTLVHLGVRQALTRSTLAYATAQRPWQLFETVFYDLVQRCQALAATKRRRFRFKHPLRTLDSTIIDLCAEVFDWARFQRTKGAVKLHLQLDHQGCLPCWALMTDGATNDVRVAQTLSLAPGTIVLIDRGYLDYALYQRWTLTGVWVCDPAPDQHAVPRLGDRSGPGPRARPDRRAHSVDQPAGGRALHGPVAARRHLGREPAANAHLLDQDPPSGGEHHCRHL
jgi:hypothetical protein